MSEHRTNASREHPINTELITDTELSSIYLKHLNVQSLKGTNVTYKTELIVETLLQRLHSNEPIDFFLLTETWISNNNFYKYMFQQEQELIDTYSIATDLKPINDNTNEENLNGQGTAIIYHNKWKPYLQATTRLQGRITALTFDIKPMRIIIGAIYPPSLSTETKKQIRKMQRKLNQLLTPEKPNTHIIMGGDWNATINPAIDRILASDTNPETHPTDTQPESPLVKKLISPNSVIPLIDPYRLLYPDEHIYSHSVSTGKRFPSQARLDYFLISHSLLPAFQSMEYQQSFCPDLHHCPIEIKLHNFRSPQFSSPSHHLPPFILQKDKLNDANIKDFNSKLEEIINHSQQEGETHPHSFSTHLLNAAKKSLPIARPSNNSQTQKKRSRKRLFNTMQFLARIQHSARSNSLAPSDLRQLNDLANKFNAETRQNISNRELFDNVKKSIIKVRSRRKEDSIKFAKRRRETEFIKNQARQIKNIFQTRTQWNGLTYLTDRQNEVIANSPRTVKKIIRKYYMDLFKVNDGENPNLNPDIPHDSSWIPFLSPDTSIQSSWYDDLCNPISTAELRSHIKDLPNNKAPGPTGVSYDFYKLLDDNNLTTIATLLTENLNGHDLPTEEHLATIFVIPKTPEFQGNADKLRPIALLETYRKLLTGILTKRLTTILDSHPILKGYNFAFRTGQSTNTALSILRQVIDYAKIQKRSFLIASLDIRKAYDTVPLSAIILTLKRIKCPNRLIALIAQLFQQRAFQIQTAYGYTNTFSPLNGIPQGDPLSPLLWLIFYDPLLIRLQQQTSGFQFEVEPTPIHISAVAYADDIHPLADDAPALQHQLNLTASYLQPFGMALQPAKCQIHSNRPADHPDFPKNFHFHINQTPIPIITPGKDPVRFLGAFWSLNGDNKNTLKRTKDYLNSNLLKLRIKHIPGRLTPHLLNTVILPCIAYQLQLLPIPDSFFKSIDSSLRSLVKSKCKLPKNLPTSIILQKDAGISLTSIEHYCKQTAISNLLVQSNSKDISFKCLQATDSALAKVHHLPLSMLLKPPQLPTTLAYKSYCSYLTHILCQNDMALNIPTSTITQSIAFHLQPAEYNQYARILFDLKLHTINQITSSRYPHYILSYSAFVAARHATNKYLDPEAVYTPPWYRTLIQTFGQFQDLQETTDPLIAFKLKPFYTNPEINPLLHPPTRYQQEIQLWTDGSHFPDSDQIGSATILVDPQTTNLILTEISSKPPLGQNTSTRAELWAIYRGLRELSSQTKISIHTDSQAAIESIKSSLQHPHNIRKLLKHNDNDILSAIIEELSRFHHPTQFIKVLAHSQNLLNDRADQIAKAAALSNLPTDQIPHSLYKMNYITQNDTRISQYPSTLLKKTQQQTYNIENHNRIQRYWQSYPNIHALNTSLTLRLSHVGPHKDNPLDVTSYLHHAFRLKIIHKQIATFDLLQKYNIRPLNPTCKRCNTETETNEHLWNCPDTHNRFPALRRRTAFLLNSSIEISTTWKEITKTKIPPSTLLQIINCNNSNFLKTLSAKGIVTDDILARFQNHPSTKKHPTTWLLYTLSCWLQSFYEIIWITRLQRYERLEKQLQQNLPRLHCYIQPPGPPPPLPTPRIHAFVNPQRPQTTPQRIHCFVQAPPPQNPRIHCFVNPNNTPPTPTTHIIAQIPTEKSNKHPRQPEPPTRTNKRLRQESWENPKPPPISNLTLQLRTNANHPQVHMRSRLPLRRTNILPPKRLRSISSNPDSLASSHPNKSKRPRASLHTPAPNTNNPAYPHHTKDPPPSTS
jgi:ribonuclease HI